MAAPIVITANLAWNLVNFRSGLIRALIARGERVVAVAPPDARSEEALAALGCEFLPVRIDPKGLSPARDFRTILDYLRIFRQIKPSAMLGYTIKPNIYGAIAARLAGVPVIANVSGLGTAFIRTTILTSVVKLLYRVGMNGANTVFFQNADDKALFLTYHLVRDQQAHLVPGSGIDTSFFCPADNQVRAHRGRFLLIARLVADKGVREYVEAARTLKSNMPTLQFSVLGFLDVENRTAIKREDVDQWVSEGLITYFPPVDDVRNFILASDCVVLPSYREGVSRVLLESAALGIPMIASDVPGCREIVVHGETGFLCKVRDADSLAEQMRNMAELDNSEWLQMAANARAKIIAEYAEERVIDAYVAALERLS